MSNESEKSLIEILLQESYQYNARIIEQMNEGQIVRLFDNVLRNHEGDDFSNNELILYNDPSISTELTQAYRHLSLQKRTTFESALIKSIQRWNPELFSEDEIENSTHIYAIDSLLSLVANIRLTKATSVIFELLHNSTLINLPLQESKTIRTKALSVLGGFDTSEDISKSLHMLMSDERFVESSPTILVLLSKSNADNYPLYLSRFLDILETNPNIFFDLERIFLSFSAVVSPEIFEKHLDQFPEDNKKQVIKHLCESEYSPYEITLSKVDGVPVPETFQIKYRNPEFY